MGQRSRTEIDLLVAQNIRRRRIQLGYSQRDIADHVKRSVTQYQKYENATNRVTIGRLVKICEFLGMSVGEVIKPWPRFRWRPRNGRLVGANPGDDT
ncbi:helix-turn-helix transcriptional regulator [uncultured Bradyrhizobium sp.]|jgi:transcriptional regulator with XRE-family HTH domain|uniref:helix-turn-helix domain-containing protein n=1 Tax=uncultured Bradyrhizobium sp. TaxID=199684 RepID=UPI00260D5D00|nr:helix-turn-helix transcriptional regulator [uncultured Bradyrhizobium sp.]